MYKKSFLLSALLLAAAIVGRGQQTPASISISSVSGLTATITQINSSILDLQAAVNMLNANTKVSAEIPAGAANGVNGTFTLKYAPSPLTSVFVYRNGLRQREGEDYRLTGKTLTFIATSVPQSGDTLAVDYMTAPQAIPSASLLAFNTQALYSSGTQTLTFSNPGPVGTVFSNWSITGANTVDFTIAGNTCGQSLAAGATCSVAIAFAPAQVGSRAAALIVTDNAVGSPQTIFLSGTGALVLPVGWAAMVSAFDNACVDVAGQAVTEGSSLAMNSCNKSTGQAFLFSPVVGGYKITHQASNIQLDVNGGPDNYADNSVVGLYTYWGGMNEIWSTLGTSDGFFNVVVNSSGKCLTAQGTSVVVSSCNGGNAQKWSLIPITR